MLSIKSMHLPYHQITKKATGTEFESEKHRVCCHKNAILGLLLQK